MRKSRGRTEPGVTRRRVLEFVQSSLSRGRSPTVREVQAALGFRAVETAREHLSRLVDEGRLAKDEGVSRGYRLPGASHGRMLVPLVGRVQAGALTEAIEEAIGHCEGYVSIETTPHGALHRSTKHAESGRELFALRVRGDSMIGAGILDGDVVVVRRQAKAESGDIVVARVGGEATVKTLKLARGRIELRPANPAFEPIVISESDANSGEEFALLGKVIEVRRYLEAVR